MARNKQKQLDEVGKLANVFENPFEMKGKWHEFFGNNNPIVLEVACGGGEYTLAMGEKFADKNFIGIDKKGDRIWRAAKKALRAEFATDTDNDFNDKSLRNVAFMRILVERLSDFFDDGEVSEIWVTFPDPQPKPCKARKRLMAKRFLKLYSQVLKADGVLHFKTDNTPLFDFALEELEELNMSPDEIIRDVHGMEEVPELLQIKTYYETKFMGVGEKIKYLRVANKLEFKQVD